MRYNRTAVALLCCCVLSALPGGTAAASGVFVATAGEAAPTNDVLRALLVWREREIDMHLRVGARGVAGDFVWIVPVADGATLSLGDESVFDAVDSLAMAHITLTTPGDDGGCGDNPGTEQIVTPTAPRADGRVGDYLFQVLNAPRAEDVGLWLQLNGYDVPATLVETLKPYAARSMGFVAVTLALDAAAGADRTLQPLVVTQKRPGDSRLLFPLAVARRSAADSVDVVVDVLAEQRYRVSNAASVALDAVATEVATQADASYGAALQAMTARAGGRLFVTEVAAPLDTLGARPDALAPWVDADTGYLTRLRARVPRDALGDILITFAHDSPDVRPTAQATTSGAGPTQALSWLAALLGAAALTARRRERQGEAGEQR